MPLSKSSVDVRMMYSHDGDYKFFQLICLCCFLGFAPPGAKKGDFHQKTPVKLPDQASFHPPQEPPQVI
jgi:hypothetical protein